MSSPRGGLAAGPGALCDDHASAALLVWGIELIHAPLKGTVRLRRGRRRRRRRGGGGGGHADEAEGDPPGDGADGQEGGGDAQPAARRAARPRETSAERRARLEAAKQHGDALHKLKHAVCVMKRRAEAAAKRVAEGKAMRQVVRRATRAEALRFRAVRVKRKQLTRANRRELKRFAAQRVALLAERDAYLQAARAEPKRILAALRVAVQRCRRWLAKAKARAATVARDRGKAARAKLKASRAQKRLTATERRLKDFLATRRALQSQVFIFVIPTPAIRALPRREWRGRRSGKSALLGREGVVLRRGTAGRWPKTRHVDPDTGRKIAEYKQAVLEVNKELCRYHFGREEDDPKRSLREDPFGGR